MTWLLKLYPPRWRARYGKEFLALIAPQPFSFATVVDIIGGAIDAWTQPQPHLAARAANEPEGDTFMVAKLMRLRCAGQGEPTTAIDGWKSAGVILGGTLLSVAVATWLHRRSVDQAYTQALMNNGWLIAFIVSMRYTSLKGWHGRAQAIYIGAVSMLITLIALGTIWINRG